MPDHLQSSRQQRRDQIQTYTLDVYRTFEESGVRLPAGVLGSLTNALTIGGFNRALANCISPKAVKVAIHKQRAPGSG